MSTTPHVLSHWASAMRRCARTATAALAACTLAVGAGVAWADGLADLENFLKNTRQGRATFTQVITAPAKAGEAAPRAKTSSGVFEFQRPDRFRFDYQRPFEQTIVADGKYLWLFDPDLNQVTQRPQADVLGNTPAALIAGSADLGAMRQVFNLVATPATDGVQWVQATPRTRDGTLQHIKLGFQGGQLSVLEVLDSFGQRSVLKFGLLNSQPGFKAGHFNFHPPAGADVIKP
ncbi:MAG: outer rane lipoprotein carrier protein LolA [Pseudomonadota bacterium]